MRERSPRSTKVLMYTVATDATENSNYSLEREKYMDISLELRRGIKTGQPPG